MYTLRPYQERGKKDILDFTKRTKGKKYGIVVAPCAAGKSLYIASTANEIIDEKILVLQPSKELLIQNFDKYISYGNEASIYSASLKSKNVGHVTFATPMSIKDPSIFKGVGLIYIDEAHLGTKNGGMVDGIVDYLGCKVVGLTGTPVIQKQGMMGTELKMMNRTRSTFFNEIIHCTQIDELIDNGFWSKIVYDIYHTDSQFLEQNTAGSEYTDNSLNQYFLENDIKEKIKEIVDKKERENYFIFAPTISACEELSKYLGGVEYLTSKTPTKERDRIIRGILSGEINIVINVNILSTGFDYPKMSCIIDCSPTMSASRWYQRWCRVVRIHKDKEDALIIDLGDNYNKFGRLEDIRFENIEGYGWGMFSNEYCLTAAPIKAGKILTKSLIKAPKPKEEIDNPMFHFGKYKDKKRVSEVIQQDGQYVIWMINNKDFNWIGQKNQILKKAIEDQLYNKFKK